jgi:hypothetical protein
LPLGNDGYKPPRTKEALMADRSNGAAAGAGAVYGLGFFGAVIYFIQTATGFWAGVLGIIKAIFWPGFVVYELMRFLEM